jgi:hypothetical protein
VGLKGDLGALVIGTLLAFHAGAGELAKSLFALKELLLIGFFVSIGFVGLPSGEHLLVALVLVLLLPLKGIGFAVLLWAVGMRRRTAVLAGTALANFSEFGLIVAVAMSADVLSDDWLVILATAIAASFTLAAAVGRRSEYLVGLGRRFLPDRAPERLHPEDRPIDVAHADAVVLGMGRVGRAAYDRLTHEYGLSVVGIETLVSRVELLQSLGYDVIEGDATDPDFWARMRTAEVDIAVLAMPFHGNNLDALEKLSAGGFAGTVAVVAQYDADLAQSFRHGAHTGIQLYEGAGSELADRAAATAARIIGTWSGIRPHAATLNAVLEDRLLSSAILRLPGHTPSSSAALAQPAAPRVRGTTMPSAHVSSATPLARMTSRWAGTQAGISGS